MTKTIRNLIGAILASLVPSASAEDATYLCVAEESMGFYYENGSWGRESFEVSNEKYIIRKMKEDELFSFEKEYSHGVFELGENFQRYSCSITEQSTNFLCSGPGQFNFSPKSGRFIMTYVSGYWDGIDNNNNTPSITRGRCSKI